MASVTANFTPKQLLDEMIDEALLMRVGTETIAVIRSRTGQGKFLEGSTSAGYYDKPSPMPIGAIRPKSSIELVLRMLRDKDPSVRAFRGKSGKAWVTLMGGYKQLREMSDRQTDYVSLTWSGAMMKSIHIANMNLSDKSVTIGFNDDQSGRIAGFHHAGAGRGRIKRIFLALAQRELDGVVKRVGL